MNEDYRDLAGIVHLVWPDWEVMENIGSGAFASVVRAARRNRIPGDKDSAIKIIRIPGNDSDWDQMLTEGKSPEQAEQYFQAVVDDSLKEIRAMEELTGNTNIVSIFDYKVHKMPDQHAWYILIRMEYLQKINTANLSEDRIIRLGVDVCTALSLCRKKNIVHRDVSLDNIFILDGNYKLGDFGVAKVLEGSVGTMHSIAGKPLYMAPEVYNAVLSDTDIESAAKVDIYSLGILLYRLSNNMNYPFENPEGENITARERNQAFRRRVIDGEALPAPANVSPGLARIILKACAADPDKRYRNADIMKADLLSLSDSTPPQASAPKNLKKRILAAALAVVFITAAFFLLRPVLIPLPAQSPEQVSPPDPRPAPEPNAPPVEGAALKAGILQEPGEWSEWSDWYEKPPGEEANSDRQEETRERHRWIALRCTYCKETNPDGLIICSSCGQSLSHAPYIYEYSNDPQGYVETYASDSDPTNCAVKYRAFRYFDDVKYWYNRPITEYRYRTRTSATDSGEARDPQPAPGVSARDTVFLQP